MQADKVRTEDYARRFEYRPEFLFNQYIPMVVDAVVPEIPQNDLWYARIEDVFLSNQETFIDVGKPNAAIVIPKPDGSGYIRMAGYSVWRQPFHIEEVTKEEGSFVQSGIWIRFLDLPPKANERLLKAMQMFAGQRFRTCVRGNMHVLEAAGFSSGKKRLTTITWPNQLIRTLLAHGLYFEGKKIEFEVIRTSRQNLEEYSRGMIFSEINAPWRHAKKTLPAPLKTLLRKKEAVNEPHYEVAPALLVENEYIEGIRLLVSTSTPELMMRQVFGSHALFAVDIDRVNIDDYFAKALKPFPQSNPDLVTRIKKHYIFSRPSIWIIRKLLGATNLQEVGEFNERDVYNMFRTDSPRHQNKYNIVVVRMPAKSAGGNPITRIFIARITVHSKIIDFFLSKHLVMAGYLWFAKSAEEKPDLTKMFVVWAGDFGKSPDGYFEALGNSGTFRPERAMDEKIVHFMQAAFPHLGIRIHLRE